jgi:putative spermidine/putrescine transport system permease protein
VRHTVRITLGLLPALLVIAALFGSGVVYGVMQSLGYLPFLGQTTLSLAAYANIVGGQGAAAEFWPSLLFSLWVSGAATLLSAALALLALPLLERAPLGRAGLLALNTSLAFPHLVWAVALLLLLAQSGVLARIAYALGLLDAPAAFPVLVRDRYGLGIIIHYVGKEVPFLLLLLLGVLRAQHEGYTLVAANLGATRWQRLRYVTLPLALPALISGSLLVFAYVFAAYEVPALLGARYPRMLSVLALEFFLNPDLRSRAEGMAIGVVMALVVLVVAGVARFVRRDD